MEDRTEVVEGSTVHGYMVKQAKKGSGFGVQVRKKCIDCLKCKKSKKIEVTNGPRTWVGL
jgi:uncharacterized protein (UPF0335 family)